MAEEQVFVSQPSTPNQEGFFKTLLGNKKLLLVIAIIVVIELVWAYNALLVPESQTDGTQSSGDEVAIPEASLKVVGPPTVKVGDLVPVDIVLQTQKSSNGVDAVIKYDSQRLELVASGSAAAKPGTLFPDYPVNSIGDAVGVINVSAVAPPGDKGFNGQGLFATLTFRALRAGTALINFDFTPSSESDSNVVDSESGRDILEKADSLEVKIE